MSNTLCKLFLENNLDAANEYLGQINSPRFAKAHGYNCPFCESACVDYIGDLVSNRQVFRHTLACRMCDSDWTESYDLTGYLL